MPKENECFLTCGGELIEARETALGEMEKRAGALGANSVIGVDIDYELLDQGVIC